MTTLQLRRLVDSWNATGRDYPSQPVHALFEAQAAASPGAVGVALGSRRVSYGEMNGRANRLAYHLRRLGVGPNVPVGVCQWRSVEMIVSLLAILKAGGAYVPLDPAYPRERLAFMMEDTRAPVVLTCRGLRGCLPQLGPDVRVACVDEMHSDLEGYPDKNPEIRAGLDDLAYVMYTSGSTGRPKGVEVIHRGVVRLVKNADYCHLGPDEVILQLAPVSFDASTFEIWGSLLNGGRLVLYPGERPSLDNLGTLIREQGVTTLWLTAGLFHVMVDERLEDLGTLRQLLAGGDVLSPTHVKRCLEAHPHLRLINGYGPTENTTFTCCHLVSPETAKGDRVPIGRPIANTQVYILDDRLNLVPAGVPGELYTGGDGLARGYLNHPELTRERFIADPIRGVPGARLYKTGDLARYLPDGNIEFLGRRDNQVKIRGFRIEPGEIEATLAQHPAVRQVVVLAREDVPGNKRLVAYLVTVDPQVPPAIEELRAFLKAKLPEYMVPSAFVMLPVMPLTPNGKVDRQALPAPDASRPRTQQAYVAPRSVLEEQLAGIWQRVLGLERVGIHDNFFVLGGHSLLATQVISRIRTALRAELPLRSLFESPTIAGLAGGIRAAQAQSRPLPPPLQPVPRDRALPLSFAQQRLWFLDQYESNHAVYNIALAVSLEGSLRTDVLRQSLEQIVERHEALRTTIQMVEGEPLQSIAPRVDVDVPLVDLRDLPGQQRQRRAQELAVAEAREPFDLVRGPLLRARLLWLSATEHVLLLTMHHIASDGWSMGVLFDELKESYRSLCQGDRADLPDLPVQYADFAIWQRQWLQGTVLDQQLAYWKQQLNGAPAVLELPTDHPRPTLQSYRGACQLLALPQELSRALQALSRQEGVTLFMTLLAGFQVLLHRYSGQTDIVVGSPIAGRNHSEIEHLIGFFVNTLALRTDLSGDPTIQELLGRVREVALGAYGHQDLPFEKLVEELNPPRSLGYAPLFQVVFVLQNAPPSLVRMPGLEVRAEDTHNGTSKFDLVLSLTETEEGLTGTLEYSTDLFDAATIQRMLGHLRQVLEGMVSDPRQRIGQLPMPGEAERCQSNDAPQAGKRTTGGSPLASNGKVDRQARPHPLAAEHGDRPSLPAAPRNELERKLVEIWEKLLHIHPIGIRDNFFDLGGHSLAVAQLSSRIERQLKVHVPLTDIFLNPTIEALAGQMEARAEVVDGHPPHIIPLQPQGHKPPLFLLPGVGGYPFSLSPLAQMFNPDRPVYGLVSIGLDGGESIPTCIEDIASQYINEMVTFRPQGPFLILGYSFGGVVAFEMARQMAAMGRTPAFLGVLDTHAPGYSRLLMLIARARMHWDIFQSLSIAGKRRYLTDRLELRLAYLKRKLGRYSAGLPSPSPDLKRLSLDDEHKKAMMKAYYNYRPERVVCDLTVFVVENHPAREASFFEDPHLGWGNWVDGRLSRYSIPGNHMSVIRDEKNISVLASTIKACLERGPTPYS